MVNIREIGKKFTKNEAKELLEKIVENNKKDTEIIDL